MNIPLGQWSGSDATEALHETVKAESHRNLWLAISANALAVASLLLQVL